MFTSDDEVDRFRDVKINTAHGIRWKINEAAVKSELPIRLRRNDGQPREGIAKCPFDCTICMSDTIHSSEWTQIEVPCNFHPLTTPLEPGNLVWQDSVNKRQKKLNESDESKHVLVIEEKKIATENVRKRCIDIYGEKLKDGPGQKRQKIEQRRAVIIVHPKLFGSGSGLRAQWVAPFRIVATADVLKSYHTAKIVERIKRIGTPCLIMNETALIKDMFTSDDEVNRFKNVKTKTAHRIQGKINEEPVSILGTADVLDFNPSAKKIKPIGTPSLILNETVVIRDMLKSDNEVDRVTEIKLKLRMELAERLLRLLDNIMEPPSLLLSTKLGCTLLLTGWLTY
ncbi:uncharacterized protein LOC113320829 [Papaver somniferum]|uniref:uncharacterized protein LOC113320829 n=1 Tax=Papaver somniferum TaxID=3469 RepID=UPI000E6FD7FB|nr:uncharacterized protein LOC113320829 [Papaver somniferum]XP_026424507.1 uncharacterized protein LOC113320829 [Papaver somniferum]